MERLVERLIQHLEQTPLSEPRRVTQNGQEILLDVSVKGLRCLVLKPKQPRVRLSPREREIARMIAKGYANKAIAAVLEISSWTVSTHLRRMFAKLGVHSRAALVTALHKQGFLADVPPTPPPKR